MKKKKDEEEQRRRKKMNARGEVASCTRNWIIWDLFELFIWKLKLFSCLYACYIRSSSSKLFKKKIEIKVKWKISSPCLPPHLRRFFILERLPWNNVIYTHCIFDKTFLQVPGIVKKSKRNSDVFFVSIYVWSLTEFF